MTYTIVIPKNVQKQLDILPSDRYDRIDTKIQQLAKNPRLDGVVKMKGSENEYRIRIGNYRVLYEINDKNLTILLLQCKHRRDIYR